MKKRYTFSIIFFALSICTFAQEHYPQNFMPNGPLERIIQSNDTIFGVGNFYMGGYRVGSMISYNGTQRDELDPNTPYIDLGSVYEAISDGNGGWYVAGQAMVYNGNNLRGVVHIKADKSLDTEFLLTQDQSFGGWIKALYLHNNILYVGGSFQNFQGFNRSHLLAYNTTTNQFVQEFDAGFTFSNPQFVNSIVVKGNELIIGGSFSSGQPASCLARLNLQTGALIHDFQVNAEVFQLFLDADTLYAGGDFSVVSGQNQRGMAKINLSNNSLMNCANIDGSVGLVRDFIVDEADIYVGGRFNTVNGQNKPLLAKLNRYSWALDAGFDVTFDLNQVTGLAIQGDQLLIGGIFNQVNGSPRKNLAQVNRNTGALHPWKPDVEGTIEKLFTFNGNPYIIGNMDQMERIIRNSFFAMKLPERRIIPINYTASGFSNSYRDIAKHGNTLFFCGAMTNATINGTPVSHLFALNIQTGVVQSIGSFGGIANPFLSRLMVHNGKLYVAGYFTQVNGLPRNRIAAFKLSDYTLDDWTPQVGGNTTATKMDVKDGKLYLSGNIVTDNPFGEYVMAALSLTDGSWQGGFLREPVLGQYYTGNDFIILQNNIYLAGNHIRNSSPFLQAAVVKMSDSFVIDPAFNGATPMNSNGGVSLTQINGVVVVMQRVNSNPDRYLYFHSPLTGDTLSRLEINFSGSQPFFDNTGMPYTYVFNNNMLYIGGNWDRVNGNAVSGLAIIDGRDESFPDLNISIESVKGANENGFQVFPNPANNLIQIDVIDQFTTRLEIFDVSGRLCHSEQLQAANGSVSINISSLNDGVYFVVLSGKDGVKTGKVVVKR